MKLVVDMGTQKKITPRLVSYLVDAIERCVDSVDDQHPTLAKMTVYLNYYDSDGNIVEVVNPKGEELDFYFRTIPYKRIPKGVKDPVTIMTRDGASDEAPIVAGYLYPRWS